MTKKVNEKSKTKNFSLRQRPSTKKTGKVVLVGLEIGKETLDKV